jgi:hypothetical protein
VRASQAFAAPVQPRRICMHDDYPLAVENRDVVAKLCGTCCRNEKPSVALKLLLPVYEFASAPPHINPLLYRDKHQLTDSHSAFRSSRHKTYLKSCLPATLAFTFPSRWKTRSWPNIGKLTHPSHQVLNKAHGIAWTYRRHPTSDSLYYIMPRLDTTEAVIARTIHLADQQSPPASPVHHGQPPGSESSDSTPSSSRSSFYVPSPDREAIVMDFEDAKSTSTEASSKRSGSFLSRLRRSKSQSTTISKQQAPQAKSHGRTDRLRNFVKFSRYQAGPDASLAANKKAYEEQMLRERSLDDGRIWLML